MQQNGIHSRIAGIFTRGGNKHLPLCALLLTQCTYSLNIRVVALLDVSQGIKHNQAAFLFSYAFSLIWFRIQGYAEILLKVLSFNESSSCIETCCLFWKSAWIMNRKNMLNVIRVHRLFLKPDSVWLQSNRNCFSSHLCITNQQQTWLFL